MYFNKNNGIQYDQIHQSTVTHPNLAKPSRKPPTQPHTQTPFPISEYQPSPNRATANLQGPFQIVCLLLIGPGFCQLLKGGIEAVWNIDGGPPFCSKWNISRRLAIGSLFGECIPRELCNFFFIVFF